MKKNILGTLIFTYHGILQESYGNRNFTAKELYSPEIFDTSSFYHKRRRFALRGYGREAKKIKIEK